MHSAWTSTVFFTVLCLAIQQSRGDIRITKEGQRAQVEVREHGSLTLECRSSTSHVKWSLEGAELTNDTIRFRILEERDGSGLISRLELLNAEPNEAGNYACFCPHSGFKDEINVKVIGHEHHRHVSINGQKRQEFDVGSELTLVCQADSHSDVKWSFNNSPVSNSTRDKVTSTVDDANSRKVVVLVRKNLEAKDFGQYRCQNTEDTSDKSVVEVALKGSGATSNSGFQGNDMSSHGVAMFTFISMLIAMVNHQSP